MTNTEYQFAANIAMGMSQSAAARAAGINASKGSELMKREDIQRCIIDQTKQIQKDLIISRNDVLQGLKEAIEDAKLQGEPMPQIAGWREIGKIVGVYAPEEKKITYEKDVTIIEKRVRELSTEKLHEYALIEGTVVPDDDENTTGTDRTGTDSA